MTRDQLEELGEAIQETARVGVGIAGHEKALSAALMAHCKAATELFQIISGCKERCEANGEMPILPLASGVLNAVNESIASMSLVAAIMVLREKSDNANAEGACGPAN